MDSKERKKMFNLQFKKTYEEDWFDDCIEFDDFDKAKGEYHRVKRNMHNNNVYMDTRIVEIKKAVVYPCL